jgi:hypothetical protein
MLRGGSRGPAIVPGKPGESLLIKAVRHEGLKMPLDGKLDSTDVTALEQWVRDGAPWPADISVPPGPGDPQFYAKITREHWAFQPVRQVVANGHPVDFLIRSELTKHGLTLSPATDRRTLIRRLSFVLTGLPPTPLEVDLFVRDKSPGAYERLVARLIQSPHFGEHWARHWMDVVRFGETLGNDWNYELHGAAHYRDYLIRAFNQDVPYNQLIREHIAGDLLENPRMNAGEGINESILGTTFFRLGEQGHDDCVRFREIRTDVVDNQIDTLGKAFQGLTIACARCHDHKLDPIPTSDYYGLYGVLTSSRMVMRTADARGSNQELKQRLLQLKPRIRDALARIWLADSARMSRYLMAAHRAWRGMAPRPEDLVELSLDRLQAWVAALSRSKLPMEDPLYAWTEASQVRSLPEEWSQLQRRYSDESIARRAFNREHFLPFDDWHPDGQGFAGSPSPPGEFLIAAEGSRAIRGIFPSGLYSGAVSERFNASLRSPYIPKNKKFLSVEVMGGNLGSRRTILDNCMLSEDYQYIDSDALTWLRIPNRDDQKSLPFYVELVTKSDNSRLPDRPDRMKKVKPEVWSGSSSYFGAVRAVLHDVDEAPKDELKQMLRLFEEPAPRTLEDLAQRYASATGNAIRSWVAGQSTDNDARWLGAFLHLGLLTNSIAANPDLQLLVAEYRALETRIQPARVFFGMADHDAGYDFPLLPRGDATNPGKPVRRGYLTLLDKAVFDTKGSGRRELAEVIASQDNPLTARVMVNRVWQHIFGRGIVASADNFGRYGDPPSHPELIDYLAGRFVRDGWSVKKLVELLVTSDTFRQSSNPVTGAEQIDPQNRLLARYPVRRLEAESVRDSVLFVSGRLDRTLYGPSIHPYRENPKDYRKLHQGPLDGGGRRSVYLKVTRHEGPRFLEIFDFPAPMAARGNRDSTNVAAQALALMNDPFVVDQAGYWADRLVESRTGPVESRMQEMFRVALGRPPADDEQARFQGLVAELASLHKVPPDRILHSREVWKDVAHALFNLKEFIYVR